MMMNMFAAAMIFAALMVISPAAAERSPAPTWRAHCSLSSSFSTSTGRRRFSLAGLIELECE